MTKAEQWKLLKTNYPNFARDLPNMPDMILFLKEINEHFSVSDIKITGMRG